MASGYVSNGTDLDSLFKARSGTARANVGYQVGGTDLAQRYEASIGGDTIASATGFQSGGTDLQSLFQDINYVPVTLSGQSVIDAHTGSDSVSYQLGASGQASYSIRGTYTNISGEWLGAGSASDYEVRATATSGTPSSGTLNTWLSLSSTREWTVSVSGSVFKSCTLTIEIRRVSDSVVVASATIYLEADGS